VFLDISRLSATARLLLKGASEVRETMMIRNLAALFLVGLSCGCSSGNSGSGGPQGGIPGAPGGQNNGGSKSYCDTACAKITQCDGSEDLQTCSASCNNDFAVLAPKLRAEYVSKLSSCFSGKDCATVLNGDAATACFDEAAASLAPTQTGTDFCNALSGAFQKCGGSVDMAGCLGAVKQYNDPTLNAAKACFSKSCSDVESCVNAQLGIQSSSSNDNSCQFAYDGMCDEPEYCSPGTDSYDCG